VVTTAEETRLVDDHDHDADPDLVPHLPCAGRRGVALDPGRAAVEVVALVADRLIRAQLLAELAGL
jgi:hypothetical protein